MPRLPRLHTGGPARRWLHTAPLPDMPPLNRIYVPGASSTLLEILPPLSHLPSYGRSCGVREVCTACATLPLGKQSEAPIHAMAVASVVLLSLLLLRRA